MKRLGVVLDQTAAPAVDIYSSVQSVAVPVLLVPPTAENRRVMPLLRRLGEVVELTGAADSDIDCARNAKLDGIVTFSETLLPATAAIATALGLNYHKPPVVSALTDKAAQRSRLAECGIDDVISIAVAGRTAALAALEQVGFPAVLKPRVGVGSRDTHLLRNRAAALRVLDAVFGSQAREEFVLEQFLIGIEGMASGDYVSVESAVIDGAIHHVAITGKTALAPPFRETGQYWPAQVSARMSRQILDLTAKALRGLGVRTGMTHTEIKLTSSGPRIIEVNGRLGGLLHDLYLRATGTDLIQVAARIAVADPLPIRSAEGRNVTFQYTVLAPTVSCQFVDCTGVDELLKHPCVERYIPHVRRGQDLAGGVGTSTMNLICGTARDIDEMLDVIDYARKILVFRFATAKGDIVRTGAQLTQ